MNENMFVAISVFIMVGVFVLFFIVFGLICLVNEIYKSYKGRKEFNEARTKARYYIAQYKTKRNVVYKGDNRALKINSEKDIQTICFTWDGLKIKAVINTRERSLTSLSCYDRDGYPVDIADIYKLAVECFVDTLEYLGLTEELQIFKETVLLAV